MSREFRLFQVDVFTRTRFAGNPASVVLDADCLSPVQMQSIARELNNSETAFLLKPVASDHDLRIRYFTPATEVPSCGHATIAAHFVRALELELPPGRYHHRIGIGCLPVDIESTDSGYRVIMTQGRPEIGAPLDPGRRHALLEALRIQAGDVASDAPMVRVDTGAPKVLVGVQSRDILDNITPDFERLRSVGLALGCSGLFVFTLADPDPDVTAHCRMFAPQIGIAEDPVTGNGNGPLGAYLASFDLVEKAAPTIYFRSRQGEAMGRPGTAHVWVDLEHRRPTAVRVGGDCVVAFQATLFV